MPDTKGQDMATRFDPRSIPAWELCNGCDAAPAETAAGYCSDCDPKGTGV